jgi:hypothetical protein
VYAVAGGSAENFPDWSHITGGGRPIFVVRGRGFGSGDDVFKAVVVTGSLGRGKRKTLLRSVTHPDGRRTW